MLLIAKSGNSFIYDDGENWFQINNDVEPPKEIIIKKIEEPFYPLAACLKWGFEPVDIKYLNKLSQNT
jgi:hypothetical protein